MYANTINITLTQTYNNKMLRKSFKLCYFKRVFVTHTFTYTQTMHKLQFMYNLNMCESVYKMVYELMFTHEFTRKLNGQIYF